MRQEIHIKESAGLDRSAEYVDFSVPCRKGELFPADPLTLKDPDGLHCPIQTKSLAFWPDGSVKWLHVISCVTIPLHASVRLTLETASGQRTLPPPMGPVRFEHRQTAWNVDTGAAAFTVPTDILAPFAAVHRSDDQFHWLEASQCRLVNGEGIALLPEITAMEWEDEGPLRATIRISGVFRQTDNAQFTCRIHFFAGKSDVKLAFTLHNPRAAKHPGGVWDLGEPNACLFKELSFSFQLPTAAVERTYCSSSSGSPFVDLKAESECIIYQESSGGKNWQSPNHRNRAGIVPLRQCGFVVKENGHQVATGQRATPIVWTGGENAGVAACLPLFWQEFPKAIEAANGTLTVSLFPGCYPNLHELQPGEQKTHVFFVDFCPDQHGLAWVRSPLEVTLPAQSYVNSGVFIDLPGQEDLVDRFTSAEQLLAKRELIDEYGWRNFGDIFADHEAAFHQGDQPFISHYNNQYDLIAGAYRKFFISGNPLWQQLAADMAQHVRDIDIYHTIEDREEYNHGLFWHTEHYADAGLSTHRSYSKEQKKTYELYAGGGGPGAEHCYTTGLMLHYFQTGNPDFKQAVLDLAEWEFLALSGPQIVMAALKRGVDNLRLLRAHAGKRKLFPHYPLTRGTGNAIIACLDAYEVSHQDKWLETAAYIIQRTLHPNDDIQARDLLNAEIGWSYTVLLTAVGKYLEKKRQLEQYDNSFHHARQSLLVYAAWMFTHEYPYLDKPVILEYPNETWAAQDIRKSVILYLAAQYAETEEQGISFCRKARFFYDHAADELGVQASSSFTRPVVLVLQNGWIGERIQEAPPTALFGEIKHQVTGNPIPYLTLWAILKRLVYDVGKAFQLTSMKREQAWLQARFRYFGSKAK